MTLKKSIFIAGTDTNIGKTHVTSLLYKALSDAGLKVNTQKWVQSGGTDNEDVLTHNTTTPLIKERSPYNLKNPASPHLSAALEGTIISIETLLASAKTLEDGYDCNLIEGSGGLFVPITRETTFIDILATEKIPVILVIPNKLGAINHALLSLYALRQTGCMTLGVVFNHCVPAESELEKTIQADNIKTICEFHPDVAVLGSVGFGGLEQGQFELDAVFEVLVLD